MGSILNRLESEQTTKLLWKYSISAIVGSLVIAIYNIVDSIYIGHGPNLGDHAIGGLGLILPIMTFFAAMSALVGTGAATRIAIYMGEGYKDKVERVLGNAFILTILLTGIFVFLAYIFIDPLLQIIGATKDTYSFAHEFLTFYLPCNIFLNLSFVLSSVMRASGYPQKAMYIMLLGVILNIILAPIFIFIFEWGMKGAAIATSIASFISFVIFLIHFLNRNSTLRLYKNKIALNKNIVWAILSIGFSPFIMQVAASIVVFFINNRLSVYGGSIAIEAYTIANRLNLVVILIIVGLTQGMQPIVGYNYGAQKIDRVISTANQAIKAGICIGFIGLIVAFFFSDIVVSPFNPTLSLADKASRVLRIITIMLPLSGLQMVISNFFQSIGMPAKAITLSLTRQFVFLVPLLFILPLFFQLDGVWFSIPLADVVSTILAITLYIYQIQKLKKIHVIT
ncbi:MAG: MATE family efflux transporter [Dysgonomonas sp.]